MSVLPIASGTLGFSGPSMSRVQITRTVRQLGSFSSTIGVPSAATVRVGRERVPQFDAAVVLDGAVTWANAPAACGESFIRHGSSIAVSVALGAGGGGITLSAAAVTVGVMPSSTARLDTR